jgi:uncharacterized protein (TIGR03435 family)
MNSAHPSRTLSLIAALALAAPLALAQANPTQPATPSGKPLAFSIVSIKPHNPNDRSAGVDSAPDCHAFTSTNLTLRFLVGEAYNLKEGDRFLIGGPSWTYTDRFNFEAKLDPSDIPLTKLTGEQCTALLQPVLADRFKLRVHHETRPILIYNIVLAKGGLKMKESAPSPPSSLTTPAAQPCSIDASRRGSESVHSCPMTQIVGVLEDGPGRYIIDKTGLTGRYTFDLHYTPDNTPADSPISGGPSIFTAVQEQLGLKLSPSTAPLDVLVIDSAQPPTPN